MQLYLVNCQYELCNYGLSHAGPAVASRGDRIRCTVMFENAQERNGRVQVPIFFTLNGTRMIILRDNQIFMDYDPDTPLYPYIAMTEGCSVLAKVRISILQKLINNS